MRARTHRNTKMCMQDMHIWIQILTLSLVRNTILDKPQML